MTDVTLNGTVQEIKLAEPQVSNHIRMIGGVYQTSFHYLNIEAKGTLSMHLTAMIRQETTL